MGSQKTRKNNPQLGTLPRHKVLHVTPFAIERPPNAAVLFDQRVRRKFGVN